MELHHENCVDQWVSLLIYGTCVSGLYIYSINFEAYCLPSEWTGQSNPANSVYGMLHHYHNKHIAIYGICTVDFVQKNLLLGAPPSYPLVVGRKPKNLLWNSAKLMNSLKFTQNTCLLLRTT